MKYCFKRGIQLLFLSSIYIILSITYDKFFYNYNSRFYMAFEKLIGLGFLILWFYWGYKYAHGFKKGLLIGITGALLGIACALLSLMLLVNSPDDSPLWIMIPWSTPILSLWESMPNINIRILNVYGMYLSVVFVILITACGGYFNKNKF